MRRAGRALFLYTGILLQVAGCASDQDVPDWIPQPSDLAFVSEQTLLDAVRAAQEVVADNPESATAWGRLGHVYLAHDWQAEAVPCYQRAVELDPTPFRWLYYLGRGAFKADPALAADAFAGAIALDSTHAVIHVYYAESLKTLGRAEEAGRHLRRAAKLDPENPYSDLRLGQIALSGRQFEEARDHLQRSIALHPEQAKAHIALAQAYLALDDKEAAARHSQIARGAGRDKEIQDVLWRDVVAAGATAEWFALRGFRYLQAGHYGYAVAELEKAVSGDHRDAEVWLNYGTALLNLQRYDEAVSALQSALAADAENSKKIVAESTERIYANLGIAYGSAGKMELAEENLQKALAVNPSSVEVMNNLAVVYRSQGRLLEAIEVLKSSLALKSDPMVMQELAALSREAGVAGRPSDR